MLASVLLSVASSASVAMHHLPHTVTRIPTDAGVIVMTKCDLLTVAVIRLPRPDGTHAVIVITDRGNVRP